MLTEAIVASVIAGSSVCSDHFENTSRFNPTDLSDYQQCVLAAHNGESAGTLGGVFWVKTGETEFVSMPVSTLQKAGSASAAKAVVMDAIIEEVIVERIVEITVENGATIDRLRAEIRGFEAAQTAILENLGVEAGADALASIQNKIDMMQADILRLMGLPTFAQGQASVRVMAPEGLSVTGEGATRTVAVADGWRLVTNQQWIDQDARATTSGFSTGLDLTIVGNDVHIDIASGYSLLSDQQLATSNVNYANNQLAAVTLTVSAPDGNGIVTISNSANSRTETVDIKTDNQMAIDTFVNGRSFEDGRSYTAGAVHATSGQTVVITGGGHAGTYYANGEDGHGSTVTQRNGSNIFDVTGANAGTLFNQDYVNTAVNNAVNSPAQTFIAANALSIELGLAGYGQFTIQVLSAQTSPTATLEANIRDMMEYVLNNLPTFDLAQAKLDAHGRFVSTTRGDSYQSGAYSNVATQDNVGVSSLESGTGNYIAWITYPGEGSRNFKLSGTGGSLSAKVDSLIEQVYDTGYNDGYNDGYTDGYADGYADGVEAVR